MNKRTPYEATKNRAPDEAGTLRRRSERSGAHYPMTEVRRETFLKVLAETGIPTWAARAASPHAVHYSGALKSFTALADRDPEFRLQWQEALAEADARLEREALRRAVEGVPQWVFQKGELMKDPDGNPAMIRSYSDRLLERLLESRMPEKWAQRSKVEHSGMIAHANGAEGVAAIGITLNDLMALSADDRLAFADLLEKISIARGERDEAPAMRDVTPKPDALPAPRVLDVDPDSADSDEAEILSEIL